MSPILTDARADDADRQKTDAFRSMADPPSTKLSNYRVDLVGGVESERKSDNSRTLSELEKAGFGGSSETISNKFSRLSEGCCQTCQEKASVSILIGVLKHGKATCKTPFLEDVT